jgi:hypothetical protein
MFFRRRPLPAADRPPLDRDERVVAFAPAEGGHIVLTNLGIWLPGSPSRLGWHEIHKASWSGRELSLVPAEVVADAEDYTVVADRPPSSFVLTDPGRVPEQVRSRVNKSIAYTAHHPLAGGGGVRVVARRVPGVNGLRWTVRYDRPGDDAPAIVAALVAAARAGVAGAAP